MVSTLNLPFSWWWAERAWGPNPQHLSKKSGQGPFIIDLWYQDPPAGVFLEIHWNPLENVLRNFNKCTQILEFVLTCGWRLRGRWRVCVSVSASVSFSLHPSLLPFLLLYLPLSHIVQCFRAWSVEPDCQGSNLTSSFSSDFGLVS